MEPSQEEVYRKVVELMLTTNMNYAQIGAEVGVTKQTIANWNARGELKELREELIRNAFLEYAPRALKTLVDLLSARSEKVRLDAAVQILDRAGFVIPEKVDFGGAIQFVEDVPQDDE